MAPGRPVIEEHPDGLVYREDFLTAADERDLLDHVEALDFRAVTMRGQTARRTVRMFGLDYDYEHGGLTPADPLPEPLEWLRERSAAKLSFDRNGSAGPVFKVPVMRSAARLALLVLPALALMAGGGPASAGAAVRYELRAIGTFKEPMLVTAPRKSKRLFVVQRHGQIRLFNRGKRIKRPFLDISKQVMTEYQRGLLSMAFAPGYSRNGRFYVMYVDRNDNVRLDEFRRMKGRPNRAAPGSRRSVLNVGRGGMFHHGGQLQFGPDGYLYMSTGVSDFPQWAQHLHRLHGKILRIDPRRRGDRPYTVPPDNPYVGAPDARPEIWASGLRNPWRFDFDPRTGGMAIGDVGEVTAEEVDYIPRGHKAANFGFPIYEGNKKMRDTPTPPGYVPPAIEHSHGEPDRFCAVMGGFFVRDKSLKTLYRRYLYADMCTSSFHSAVIGKSGVARKRRRESFSILGPISFGEDSRGRVYTMGQAGPIFRIVWPKKRR